MSLFNDSILDVLSKINGITNSVILKYPKTVAVSDAQDVMVHVDLEKLGSSEFPNIGLNNSLSEFLSVFKLFKDDRVVEINDSLVNITDSNINSSYITSNIDIMEMWNKDATQFDKTESIPGVADFVLNVDDIKRIKDASSVFKDLSEVIITSRDNDIEVSLGATNKFNAKSNTFTITKQAQTSKEFQIKIPVENFKMIPVTEYEVSVKYNSQRDAYRILLNSKTLEGFKLLMSVKV